MTIYFCGSEDLDFDVTRVDMGVAAGSLSGRSAYERAYFSLGGNELDYGVGSLTETVSGEGMWLSMWSSHSGGSGFWGRLLCLEDSATGDQIGVGATTAYERASIFTRTGGSTTWRGSETGASMAGTFKIDLHIVSMGESGEAYVYVNTNEVLHYTGQLTAGSSTTFDRICVYGGTGGSAYWITGAEVIAADIDTRLMALKSLAPDSAGSGSGEWTGAYTAIDEAATSDIDMIYTTSSGENNIWNCNVTGWPTGDWICHAVKMAYRAADGVGGFGVYGGIRTSSTEYSGELQTPSGAFSNYKEYWQNNPYTSNRWTSGEINALQLSFKAVGV